MTLAVIGAILGVGLVGSVIATFIALTIFLLRRSRIRPAGTV